MGYRSDSIAVSHDMGPLSPSPLPSQKPTPSVCMFHKTDPPHRPKPAQDSPIPWPQTTPHPQFLKGWHCGDRSATTSLASGNNRSDPTETLLMFGKKDSKGSQKWLPCEFRSHLSFFPWEVKRFFWSLPWSFFACVISTVLEVRLKRKSLFSLWFPFVFSSKNLGPQSGLPSLGLWLRSLSTLRLGVEVSGTLPGLGCLLLLFLLFSCFATLDDFSFHAVVLSCHTLCMA